MDNRHARSTEEKVRGINIFPFILIIVAGSSAWAQRDPHVGYIYPAGGQQGTSFQAVLGGERLDGATTVIVSGAGVCMTVRGNQHQVSPDEQKKMTETLSAIQEKRKSGVQLAPEERQTALDIEKTLTAFGRRLSNPSLGEFLALDVAVASNAAPGRREIRVMTVGGLANPLVFHVGQYPEHVMPAWRNVPMERESMDPFLPTTTTQRIELPATLNGQIHPSGANRYRFQARAGQDLVIAASARALIPYLADAVPGWFQATLALYDANGNELTHNDDYKLQPDPIIFFRVPRDGDYELAIKDALFRGREDFVYRITIGRLTFAAHVFPIGGKVGSMVNVAVEGWNLPKRTSSIDLRHMSNGILPLTVNKWANPVPFAVDSLPELDETEPHCATNPMPVRLPVIINGRIGSADDDDAFSFSGKAGQHVVAEVYARRLDSPLDSLLTLADTAGVRLAFNDDHEDKAVGLNTHHADAYLRVTLPTNAKYTVYLSDVQRKGGEWYGYRLRLSAPQPDFELRVTPSSINIHGGACAPITVHALRKDGFDGSIALVLKDAPEGFALAGACVPEHRDRITLTLSAPPGGTTHPTALAIEGHAVIKGREVAHAAVPADDVMQAFAYRHLVPTEQLVATVVGRFRKGTQARIVTPIPVRIKAGATIQIAVSMPKGPAAKTIQYELSGAPEGISLGPTTPSSVPVRTDATKVVPGQKGNLIIAAWFSPQAEAGHTLPYNKQRISLGALPAVPYEIVP